MRSIGYLITGEIIRFAQYNHFHIPFYFSGKKGYENYLKQVNRNHEPLEIVDVMHDQLHKSAKKTTQNILSFLELGEIFGDLINDESFTALYSKMLDQIYWEPDIRKHMEHMVKSATIL